MNVKTLCLALLSHGAATGYEIKKEVEEGPTGYFYHAGYGSIYPALNTLEKDGLVACTTEAQDGRPPRKIYDLTPAGQAALTEALQAPPVHSRVRIDALFQLFFGEHLAPGRALEVATAYRADVQAQLDALENQENCDCSLPGQEFVHGLGMAVYAAILAYIDEHMDLLREEPEEVKKAS